MPRKKQSVSEPAPPDLTALLTQLSQALTRLVPPPDEDDNEPPPPAVKAPPRHTPEQIESAKREIRSSKRKRQRDPELYEQARSELHHDFASDVTSDVPDYRDSGGGETFDMMNNPGARPSLEQMVNLLDCKVDALREIFKEQDARILALEGMSAGMRRGVRV